MIQRVSTPSNNTPSFKKSSEKPTEHINDKINRVSPYVDSFISNAKQSTPMFLGVTALWAVFDKSSRKIPLKKAFMNNLKGFFVPVILISSALLSFVENKKPSKDKK